MGATPGTMSPGGLTGPAARPTQPGPHPLRLQVTLMQDALAVPHLGLEQVLLGDREEQALGVQGPDDVIPDRAAITVIATEAPRHVFLDHLGMGRYMAFGIRHLSGDPQTRLTCVPRAHTQRGGRRYSPGEKTAGL